MGSLIDGSIYPERRHQESPNLKVISRVAEEITCGLVLSECIEVATRMSVSAPMMALKGYAGDVFSQAVPKSGVVRCLS